MSKKKERGGVRTHKKKRGRITTAQGERKDKRWSTCNGPRSGFMYRGTERKKEDYFQAAGGSVKRECTSNDFDQTSVSLGRFPFQKSPQCEVQGKKEVKQGRVIAGIQK